MVHGDRADKRIPVTADTRQLLRDAKDEKDTYDKFIRDLIKEYHD